MFLKEMFVSVSSNTKISHKTIMQLSSIFKFVEYNNLWTNFNNLWTNNNNLWMDYNNL